LSIYAQLTWYSFDMKLSMIQNEISRKIETYNDLLFFIRDVIA
jgi:hypothetical protein